MRVLRTLTSIAQILMRNQFFCALLRSQGRRDRREEEPIPGTMLLRRAGLFWYSSPNGRLVHTSGSVK